MCIRDRVAGEGGDLNVVLLLSLFGFDSGAQGFGCRLPGFVPLAAVKQRNLKRESKGDIVWGEVFEVCAVVVQRIGIEVVLRSKKMCIRDRGVAGLFAASSSGDAAGRK